MMDQEYIILKENINEIKNQVTLQEVLDFREEKVRLRNQMAINDHDAICSLSMNIPGPIKNTIEIRLAFFEGMHVVDDVIKQHQVECLDKDMLMGNAGYAVVYSLKNANAKALKEAFVEIENTHVLGRLFDIDVWDGKDQVVSRQDLGLPKRKCLLCDDDAKVCGRSRKHSVEELQKKVFDMLKDWKGK